MASRCRSAFGCASAFTIPRRVRISCSVAPMRVNIERIFCTTLGRFPGGVKKPLAIELALDMLEEAEQLLPGGRRRAAGPQARLQRLLVGGHAAQRAAAGLLHPFVADQQDGLRQVERGEGGVDRGHHDGVGIGHLLGFQAVALGPEQDAAALALRDAPAHLRHGLLGREHGLGEVALARAWSPPPS